MKMVNPTICAPCNDSPFSLTANILTFLTFAYALIFAITYRMRDVRRANADILHIIEELALREIQLKVCEYELGDTLLGDSLLIAKARMVLQQLDAMVENTSAFKLSSEQRSLKWSLSLQIWTFLFDWGFLGKRDGMRGLLGRLDVYIGIARARGEEGAARRRYEERRSEREEKKEDS